MCIYIEICVHLYIYTYTCVCYCARQLCVNKKTYYMCVCICIYLCTYVCDMYCITPCIRASCVSSPCMRKCCMCIALDMKALFWQPFTQQHILCTWLFLGPQSPNKRPTIWVYIRAPDFWETPTCAGALMFQLLDLAHH